MSTDVRSTRDFEDDGFHEIQLSGKQLVFLCMATTVVSIVIFLCGVLVGRGVRPVETIAEAASARERSRFVTASGLPRVFAAPHRACGALWRNNAGVAASRHREGRFVWTSRRCLSS